MLKNLTRLFSAEKLNFFNSFDHIFCDVDGVLWNLNHQIIPGAQETITKLKSLNKRIFYTTNNCSKTQETYYEQLKTSGFDLSKEELIRPTLHLIQHLKKINFSKKIYLIGVPALREELQEEGFQIESFQWDSPYKSISLYVEKTTSINPEVGAVVIYFDLNLQAAHLQKAATYLQDPSILFFTVSSDRKLLYGDVNVIGPRVYQEIVENITGRVPICFGKPSAGYNHFIKEKLEIKDPARVLVIGDSVPQDMAFARNCGYKKLLVLSGITTESSIKNWDFNEELKPDFYIRSLGEMFY